MGPLPKTQAHKYILLIGDQLSKNYEAVALPIQEANTVERAFVEQCTVRFSCSVNLQSNQVSNSKDINNILLQENAMNKRTTRTEELLSKYIGQNHHEWTKSLPLAMMAYQSSIHSVTEQSTAYVVLGFLLSLPIDYIYSAPQNAINATPSNYVFTMKWKLQETHQLTRDFTDVEQERQNTYYD